MSDETPTPRPKPGPQPHDGPLNYVTDRRKVVMGLGFGVASVAGLRTLGEPVVRRNNRLETAPASNDEVLSVTEPEVFEAPVFDATARMAPGQTADITIAGGRVIDPESGFDRIGNVALIGNRIVEISEDPIPAATTVDATGHVVSPGFIDMLSYSPNGYGEWWKVADGVTSNIGMHGLRFDANDFHTRWSNEGVPIHFGGAAHSGHLRSAVGFRGFDTADASEIPPIVNEIQSQIRAGYLGVSVHPEYDPGVSQLELIEVGRICAELDVPVCVHARFSDNVSPGIQADATAELVTVARETGAHVHIEHINSTGGTGRMAEALAELEAARSEGLRLTACMYPYEFWATTLQSERFVDWQEKFGLTYSDLQIAGRPDRLTEATFDAAKEENLLAAAYAIPPGDIVLGLQSSFMMIGSDAILETNHNNHPRSTGCFSRVLGVYVRDQNVIPLIDALAMMTVRPADLLSLGSPAMRSKGRMQIGADADVTVFDPATIIDRSTVANPAQESVGVHSVFVDGVAVRSDGANVITQFPGTAIMSQVT